MMASSNMIAWECGACTFTNEDCTCCSCKMCQTEHPKQYYIIAGTSKSTSAHTTTINRREQARLAARHSHDAAASCNPSVTEGVTMVALEPAVLGDALRKRREQRKQQEHLATLRHIASAEYPSEKGDPIIVEAAPVIVGA
jgi:hypothetical protein